MPLPRSPGPRILAVCAVDEPGGAEIGLLRLVDRLHARGWRPTLTSPQGGSLRDHSLQRGWDWAPLDCGGLEANARGRLRAMRSWPRARRLAAGADVVYLNGTVCGRLLPALLGSHSVLHVHDMVHRVPAIWRRAAVVLADSHAVADALGDLRAHVVYCPVELEPDAVDPPWVPDGRPVVGFVGRIEPRKAPLDLVAAAPAIRSAAPGCRIVVVGDDPYRGDPEYVRRVRASREVEHFGWFASGPGLMRHLDVLVAPSRREPFGTVVAEAMAVGTPVVATRVDGLTEVVQDGVTGLLVDPGCPDQLARAIVDVLGRRDEMGAAAALSVQRFGADAYSQRVERLIAPTA